MNYIEQIKGYMTEKGITRNKMASLIGMPSTTFRDLMKGVKPRPVTEQKIIDFLSGKQPTPTEKTPEETTNQERVEKLKHVLLLLELELRPFIQDEEARKLLRKKVDFADVGYLTSQINMMDEEERFKRWKSNSNYKFNFFRKG